MLGDGTCADIGRASIITTEQKIQSSVFTHVASTTLERSSTPTGLVWETNMADVTSCELYSYFCNNFILRSNVDFFTRCLSKPSLVLQ